eukprot:scaffold306_cov525-Prasinococcus_capsulatus_cf.AAC.68
MEERTLFFWKSLTAKRPTKRLAKVHPEITRETSDRLVTTARFGAADLRNFQAKPSVSTSSGGSARPNTRSALRTACPI